MRSSLADAGVEVTANIAVEPGKDEYADAVAKAAADNPQLVYVITYYPEGGLIAKAMLEAGTSARCLADFGAYDNAYVKAAGLDAAKNCPLVGVPAPGDFPGSKALVDAYRSSSKEVPGTWAPYAYDSVKLLAAAATTAGGFEAKPLRSALEAVSGWKGWTGSVAFDAKTGNRLPAPVVVVSASDDGTLHVDDSWAIATSFKY